ncbi:MAG: hypothetical protein LBL17_00115 [Coxiellaceae bacterium]|jgi:NADH:ubiquinone oxidoreductase subunit 5 (subunit L)/multisubunit Na+/H+ antiporter MnhA subunit|nr:hypothetical protein [Coxiellaceae bacterium]
MGVAFLGQARTRYIQHAQDPKLSTRFALGFLALLCLFFGILPTVTISALNLIAQQLINAQLPYFDNWMWLIPLTKKVSSYNALFVSSGIIIIGFVTYFFLRIFFGRTKVTIVQPWDCGYGGINQRMQYSATAFAMPIRRVFQSVYSIREKIEKIGNSLNYSLQIGDRILRYLYNPLEQFSFMLARNYARLQGGNVWIYLTYIFITLILLLWTVL